MLRLKSVLVFALSLTLLLTAAACGGNSAASSGGGSPPDTATSSESPKGQEAPSQNSPESEAPSESDAPQTFLGEFSAEDLEGNPVDQTIFEEYKLTMINVWGTFCGPCIREMPDLAQVHENYKEQGFQVVGIVIDALDQQGAPAEPQVAAAKEIAEQTGATYLHIIPNLNMARLAEVAVIPTTYFVNEKGEIVGKAYRGAKDLQGWSEIVEGLLAELPSEE